MQTVLLELVAECNRLAMEYEGKGAHHYHLADAILDNFDFHTMITGV